MNKLKNVFRPNTTTVRNLKDVGIKLKKTTSKYDKNKVYFDIETTADAIYSLNCIDIYSNSYTNMIKDILNNTDVMFSLDGFNTSFVYKNNFNYIDVFKKLITPDKIRVRIFGEAENDDNALVCYKIQYVDLLKDLTIMWNRFIKNEIIRIEETDDRFTEEFKSIKRIISTFKPINIVENNTLGTFFTFNNYNYNYYINMVKELNINSSCVSNDNKIIVNYSNTNRCTFTIKYALIDIYIVNIWTTNNNTGIKGESKKVKMSVYGVNNKLYYETEVV